MKNVLSFTLRIEEELMEKLRELAEKENRSANSQINYLIKKYIEENEKKPS